MRILEQWDVVILDPHQQGVLEAISSQSVNLPSHVIGRLDLLQHLEPDSMSGDRHMLQAIDKIVHTIRTKFKQPECSTSRFTGVLIAGWEDRLTASVFDSLTKLLMSFGFNVFLEISPPKFLNGGKAPDMKLFSGVVVRNGTILRNGERRDFFGMAEMKSTVKEFVTQACLRDFMVMMWETLDDNVQVSHAVIRRSYTWCGFYSALTWIGLESSLTDYSTNDSILEPLAAFHWLKEPRVMKIHEVWRSNRKVRP
jgi:hypothetical protein